MHPGNLNAGHQLPSLPPNGNPLAPFETLCWELDFRFWIGMVSRYSSCCSQPECPGCPVKRTQEHSERQENRAACPGTRGLEGRPKGDFPGSPFPPSISDWTSEKPLVQKGLWVQTQEAPRTACSKARQTLRQCPPYEHCGENVAPPLPAKAKWAGTHTFPWTYGSTPHPSGWCQRRLGGGPGLPSPLSSDKAPSVLCPAASGGQAEDRSSHLLENHRHEAVARPSPQQWGGTLPPPHISGVKRGRVGDLDGPPTWQ